MHKLIIALCLLPSLAFAQHKTAKLGTLLDAVDLSGVASTRTFYIGNKIKCADDVAACSTTSSTDNSRGEQILGYSKVRLEFTYTHSSAGTLTTTCTEGATRVAATGTIATSTLANGTYTLVWSGVVVTPSLSASRIWPVTFRLTLAPVIKCVIEHSASAGTLTITGQLIAD